MRKVSAVAVVLALCTVAATRAGGWAVVTVENVPDYLIAENAQTVTFQVRQHGKNLVGGLKPRIEARKGLRRVEGRAWETPAAGIYRGSITVPEPGDWHITIESGFGRSKGKLLPLRAITAADKRPAEVAIAERGRRLFAAKGCVTCHVHRAVNIEGEAQGVGPELTGRRFAAHYLAQFLADPSIKPQSQNAARMPNLALRGPEITSLVAFINSERKLSAR